MERREHLVTEDKMDSQGTLVLLDLKESEVLSEKEVRKVKKESQEKTVWMEHRVSVVKEVLKDHRVIQDPRVPQDALDPQVLQEPRETWETMVHLEPEETQEEMANGVFLDELDRPDHREIVDQGVPLEHPEHLAFLVTLVLLVHVDLVALRDPLVIMEKTVQLAHLAHPD